MGVLTLSLGGLPVLAQEAPLDAEPTVETSPTEVMAEVVETELPTGPTGPTGPTQPTGTTVQTGPTGPNGAPCQTGVTYTGGYCQGFGQGTTQGVAQGVGQNVPTATTAAASGALENSETGAGSTNTNDVANTNTTDLGVTNTATATNTVDMDLSTGSNELTSNTSVGSLTSGDIQGSLTLVNALNSVFAPGSSVGLGTVATDETGATRLSAGETRAFLPSNAVTGADSTNTNAYAGLNAIAIRTDNTAVVDNDVDIAADTGNNLIDSNTQFGDVATGSIDLAVNLINLLNLFMPDTLLTLDVWSLFGDVTGDILMGNEETGANSTNANEVTNTAMTDIDVTNTATIDNVFDINPTTGNNTFDRNSVVGDIETGAVNVEGSVTNVANVGTPIFYIVNVLGDWSGGDLGLPAGSFIINELGNLMTGADSTNENTVDDTTTVDVDVVNDATVTNRLGIAANTGGNTFSRNTQLGDVKTGDINILANVLNFLNSTGSTLGKFSLGIVNIFGDWKAKPVKTASTAGVGPMAQQPVVVGSPTTSLSVPVSDVEMVDEASPTAPLTTLAASSMSASRQVVDTVQPNTSFASGAISMEDAVNTLAAATDVDDSDEQVLTAAAERHLGLASAQAVSNASETNWQLVIALVLAGLFIASWGAVEVLTVRRSRG